MKKVMIAVSMLLILFAFASCDNNAGKPGFDGDAGAVVKAIDAVKLVKNVFNDAAKEGSGVSVTYSIASKKAISAGEYTVTATAAFDDYELESGMIIRSGSLVYAFDGSVSASGRFTASSYSVTSKGLKVEGTETGSKAVDVSISIEPITLNTTVFQATVDTSASVGPVELSSVAADIRITSEVSVTVADQEPETVPGTDTDAVIPSEPEYTQEEILIDYIESINRNAVIEDLIASAKGEDSPIELTFTYPAEGKASEEIEFTVAIAEGKSYTTGFHDGNPLNRAVTGGKVEVVVNGSFADEATAPAEGTESAASIATFNATGYTIKGSGTVTDDKYGTHALDVDITGNFTASITLVGYDDSVAGQEEISGGLTFQLDDLEFSLPAASGVTIKMDGETDPVDYAAVLEVVGPTTGTGNGN